MANIHYSAYGGTCPDCQEHGSTWLSPSGDQIKICAEHEVLVRDAPGWSLVTRVKATSLRVSTLTGQPCSHPQDHICIECGTDDEIGRSIL